MHADGAAEKTRDGGGLVSDRLADHGIASVVKGAVLDCAVSSAGMQWWKGLDGLDWSLIIEPPGFLAYSIFKARQRTYPRVHTTSTFTPCMFFLFCLSKTICEGSLFYSTSDKVQFTTLVVGSGAVMSPYQNHELESDPTRG